MSEQKHWGCIAYMDKTRHFHKYPFHKYPFHKYPWHIPDFHTPI